MSAPEWNGPSIQQAYHLCFTDTMFGPDLYRSLGWVSSCKVKGRLFDSWSGHKPALQACPQLGHVQEATDRYFSLTLMFLSLSFSLPAPLSKRNNLRKISRWYMKGPACHEKVQGEGSEGMEGSEGSEGGAWISKGIQCHRSLGFRQDHAWGWPKPEISWGGLKQTRDLCSPEIQKRCPYQVPHTTWAALEEQDMKMDCS